MTKLVLIALLSLTSLGFTATTKKSAHTKETYYYFCLSREIPADKQSTAKRQLVYTAIRELTGDENDIHQLSKRFADYVNKGCKPGNELCTSDLNYYPNRQQAEQRRKAMLAGFEATGNY
ncbi:MAG: hypothetical protein EOO39_06840, partial [Cytophagaceae bacterium]